MDLIIVVGSAPRRIAASNLQKVIIFIHEILGIQIVLNNVRPGLGGFDGHTLTFMLRRNKKK